MKALVLGGKGSIGQAIVEQLANAGHDVLAVGREDFDLAHGDQIARFFEHSRVNFDILVHSGGYNVPGPFEALRKEEILYSLEANLFGFLDVVRYCIPQWKSKHNGRIVVLSSLYGFLARDGRLPYVMSKHALVGAVKTLAIELAPLGVLVNSVSPGYVATSLTHRNNSKDEIEHMISGIPLRRLGSAREIAHVVGFLCSNLNTYITGQDIVVDGGFSVGGFQ